MQTITAGPLVLEPLTVAHAEVMYDVLADPQIYRYLDYGPPLSLEHLLSVYRTLETRKSPDGSEIWLNWVVRVGAGEPVGVVQATCFAPNSAWIAYVLASRHWGHGYARLATKAMLTHLSTDYGVTHFLATVEVENERSIHLLEHLAFRLATVDETAAHDLTATERLFVRSEAIDRGSIAMEDPGPQSDQAVR